MEYSILFFLGSSWCTWSTRMKLSIPVKRLMYGTCTSKGAGTFSLQETASENNTSLNWLAVAVVVAINDSKNFFFPSKISLYIINLLLRIKATPISSFPKVEWLLNVWFVLVPGKKRQFDNFSQSEGGEM